MSLSQRCQYSLRALYDLALHYGDGHVKAGDIAQAQVIPQRFLENILAQLKQGGFVESVRGRDGGYSLSVPPHELSVGAVIRFADGPIAPVECMTHPDRCAKRGQCAFMPMWERAREALSAVYDSTTFADLMQEEGQRVGIQDFSI